MRLHHRSAQQETKHLPKIKTNSDKGGYKKNPRRVYGPDYVPIRRCPRGGNDGLMESEENIKPFPLFPTVLEIADSDSHITHRTTTTNYPKDIY